MNGVVLEEGTLASWLQGRRTSTHRWIPGDWISTWESTKSEAAQDYSRFVDGVEYTEEALRVFLENAWKHPSGKTWPAELQKQIGAYYGVSAFDNPQAALRYAEGTQSAHLVAFEGQLLDGLPPEADEGGIRVRWIRDKVGPLSLPQFQQWLRDHPQP